MNARIYESFGFLFVYTSDIVTYTLNLSIHSNL